jgi:hypothetical protein
LSFQDKSIRCFDCRTTFIFSAGEQEFFQSKGFTNEPKRCPSSHVVEAKKNNVLAMETTTIVPSGEYFVPATSSVEKIQK